ncbi:MAG TPA: hypothetical protein VIJ23_05120, partial [Mycobacterium sp.]
AEPAPVVAPPSPFKGGPGGLVRVPGRRSMVTSTPEPEPSPVIGPRLRGQALRRRTPITPTTPATGPAVAAPTSTTDAVAPVTPIEAVDDAAPSDVAAAGPAGRRSAAERLGIVDKPITFT